eukprot:5644667-Pleurochrysis_carterae.AAC.1
MNAYLREAGFYSDAAASDDENPGMRWAGREVKSFLREADVLLPFLRRIALVPEEVLGDLVQNDKTGASEMELEENDELVVTEEALARIWDNFLAYVAAAKQPWASLEGDTDEYHKARAVDF